MTASGPKLMSTRLAAMSASDPQADIARDHATRGPLQSAERASDNCPLPDPKNRHRRLAPSLKLTLLINLMLAK